MSKYSFLEIEREKTDIYTLNGLCTVFTETYSLNNIFCQLLSMCKFEFEQFSIEVDDTSQLHLKKKSKNTFTKPRKHEENANRRKVFDFFDHSHI